MVFTAEWVTAVSSVIMLLVVTGSVIAALRQLRHMHDANQLEIVHDFHRAMESERFQAAQRLVKDFPKRALDAEFRQHVVDSGSAEFQLLCSFNNYLEHMATVIKHDMIDRELACDLFSTIYVRTWENLAPLISTVRTNNGVRVWEDFEFMVIECRRFQQRHPNGTFPQTHEPLLLPAPWTTADMVPVVPAQDRGTSVGV